MRRYLRQRRKRQQKRAKLAQQRNSTPDQQLACQCGKTIFFANTDLCEDCWVENQFRWHGNDQSAKIN